MMAINLPDRYMWVCVGGGQSLHIAPLSSIGRETLCGRHHTMSGVPTVAVRDAYMCPTCLARYERLEAARRAAIQDADDEERLWPSGPDCE